MTINLQKGQKISLSKEAGTTLSKIIMGLGWDAKKSGGFFSFGGGSQSIDLDASCVMFDTQHKAVDTVYFGHLKSKDGSVLHTGDNLTGEGEGDDEQIIVDLSKIPENVVALVFTVNSFTGQTFDKVNNAYCRLVNSSNKQEVARYTLSAQGSHTAQIMAKLYRHDGEWKMHAIGENGTGRTIENLLPLIVKHL